MPERREEEEARQSAVGADEAPQAPVGGDEARRTAAEAVDLGPWEALAQAVAAPDFIVPWLDRFYEPDDAELVRLAAGEPHQLAALPAERLASAVKRAVLDSDETGGHKPASFLDRLDVWAMFEGWKDVPREMVHRLGDWAVADYTEWMRPPLEALREGRPTGARDESYTYLLLQEAEAIVRAQPHVYLWPCDCRAIIGACRKPANVCLRFVNDRGIGWEISRERAVQVLQLADRSGLMHTGQTIDLAPDAICNCCNDCCFPHLATVRLGSQDVWPRRRHVAVVDEAECIACGRCAERCPFGAITCGFGGGRAKLDPAACRGCGLCATDCGPEAVTMQPRD